MPAPLSVGFETVPEPVRSSHTLSVTAQDNGRSLILRPGETLQVVLGGNESNRLGWKASRLTRPCPWPLAAHGRRPTADILAVVIVAVVIVPAQAAD